MNASQPNLGRRKVLAFLYFLALFRKDVLINPNCHAPMKKKNWQWHMHALFVTSTDSAKISLPTVLGYQAATGIRSKISRKRTRPHNNPFATNNIRVEFLSL
jgi:hypothetical protein